MTLKGLPQSKRDQAWHKKHGKKLSKAKKRRVGAKRNKDDRKVRASIAKADKQFKEAQLREFAKELTWKKQLWLRFISIRGIVLLRKVAYYFSKKYARSQRTQKPRNKAKVNPGNKG